MLREDIRGICHRPCIYNDKGKCDMWDELSVPDETEDTPFYYRKLLYNYTFADRQPFGIKEE